MEHFDLKKCRMFYNKGFTLAPNDGEAGPHDVGTRFNRETGEIPPQ